MAVINQTYELVDVGRLQPHPDNPRRGDVDVIAESVEANGFYGALVVQRSTGYVLAGNHRLLAAKQTGLAQLPVTWVDVDDERARRILLVDNRANDLADYDDVALAALLGDLPDLAGTGYTATDLAKLLDGDGPADTADALADTEDRYDEQYGVIVICKSEDEQERTYGRLRELGYEARVVTT